MDTAIIAIAICAVVIIAALFLALKVRAKFKGPLNTEFELDASKHPPVLTPGVHVEDAKSRHGGLKARDETGRGANVQKIDVRKDIDVSSTLPPGDSHPKAPPPA